MSWLLWLLLPFRQRIMNCVSTRRQSGSARSLGEKHRRRRCAKASGNSFTTSKGRMRKVQWAGFELQEAQMGDEAKLHKRTDELLYTASSLSWSNTPMTPLGHSTHEIALVPAFRISLHPILQLHSGTVFACSSDFFFFPFLSSRNEDWYDRTCDLPDKICLHRLQDLFLCAIWTPGLPTPAHRLRCVYWRAESSSHLCPVSSISMAHKWG